MFRPPADNLISVSLERSRLAAEGSVKSRQSAITPRPQNENGGPGPAWDSADAVTGELISRTSIMRYKGARAKPLPQIGRELGVDVILEGTVVRFGHRVRVTARLIEGRTDRHIWADRCERSAPDTLLVEAEIARAIAEQLCRPGGRAAESGALVCARLPGRTSRLRQFRIRRWCVDGIFMSSRYLATVRRVTLIP